MCHVRTQVFTTCGHVIVDSERCQVYPDCRVNLEPREIVVGDCPNCNDNRSAQHGRDNDSLADLYSALPPLRRSTPRAAHPRPSSDPHISALRSHQTELQNGYLVLRDGLNRGAAQAAPPAGTMSPQDDILELANSMYRPVMDLNRRYVEQLGGLIDVLSQRSGRSNLANLPHPGRNALRRRSPPGFDPFHFEPPGFTPPGLDAPPFDLERYDIPAGIPGLNTGLSPTMDRPPQTPPQRQPSPAFGIMVPISVRTLSAEERRCTVCLQDIGTDVDIYPIRLPCLHVFGNHCIERWLAENRTCPVCRHDYSHDI
jgi:hypothetical protein